MINRKERKEHICNYALGDLCENPLRPLRL